MPYELLPASQDESGLCYRLDGEAAERHGAIGYLRADFSKSGREFYATWFDSQPHLKTYAFKQEFDGIINSLRDDGEMPPFASRSNLQLFCTAAPGEQLNGRGDGYRIQTQDYTYYFRCKPAAGDYDVYCMAYDNRYLLPELAGKHKLPEYCYSTTPSSGDVIVVRSGEQGCYACQYNEHDKVLNREYVRAKNEELGVTRAQEEAMRSGSMFGWNTPAAKPWNYDQNGKPRPPAPKNKEQER